MNKATRQNIAHASYLERHHDQLMNAAGNHPQLSDRQHQSLTNELLAGILDPDAPGLSPVEREVRTRLCTIVIGRHWARSGYPLVVIDPLTLEGLAETDPPAELIDGLQIYGIESGDDFLLVRWTAGRTTGPPAGCRWADDQYRRLTVNIAYALKTRPEGLDIREHRPSPKAMRKQGRKHYPTVQYIIQAARGLHPPEATGATRGPRDEGWTMSVRTMVRGHWRQQAHGPHHSLRKVIWIRPTWRGPEDAPISIHATRLKSSEPV